MLELGRKHFGSTVVWQLYLSRFILVCDYNTTHFSFFYFTGYYRQTLKHKLGLQATNKYNSCQAKTAA